MYDPIFPLSQVLENCNGMICSNKENCGTESNFLEFHLCLQSKWGMVIDWFVLYCNVFVILDL